jgi:hypothetical protein
MLDGATRRVHSMTMPHAMSWSAHALEQRAPLRQGAPERSYAPLTFSANVREAKLDGRRCPRSRSFAHVEK